MITTSEKQALYWFFRNYMRSEIILTLSSFLWSKTVAGEEQESRINLMRLLLWSYGFASYNHVMALDENVVTETAKDYFYLDEESPTSILNQKEVSRHLFWKIYRLLSSSQVRTQVLAQDRMDNLVHRFLEGKEVSLQQWQFVIRMMDESLKSFLMELSKGLHEDASQIEEIVLEACNVERIDHQRRFVQVYKLLLDQGALNKWTRFWSAVFIPMAGFQDALKLIQSGSENAESVLNI